MCAFIFVKTAGGHIINGIDNPFRVFFALHFFVAFSDLFCLSLSFCLFMV